MKSLMLSLLATLVGLAMLVVGIAGVAGAFESDEDSGSSSSSSSASVDVSDFDDCDTTDSRFDEFTTVELSGSGGSANVIVTCQGGVELSLIGTGLSTEESRTVSLWLYNSRNDAEVITSSQQEAGDPTVILSGQLPEGSSRFQKLVITEGPPSDGLDDPSEPGRVILQARL